MIISTPGGQLPCKRIFFIKWEPNSNSDILRQSIVDLIWNVIQNVISYGFTSVAFPAIGCGEHDCSVDIVVKTMVSEMTEQIQNRKLPWNVKFVIHPHQQNVYDEFCKRLSLLDKKPVDYHLPLTWQLSKEDKLQTVVPEGTEEYKTIHTNFHQAIAGDCKKVIKIERIQNERWYMQYLAHSNEFQKRLNKNTEKILYHGCPEAAADSIIRDCFNRSFAGVNGIFFVSVFSIKYTVIAKILLARI